MAPGFTSVSRCRPTDIGRTSGRDSSSLKGRDKRRAIGHHMRFNFGGVLPRTYGVRIRTDESEVRADRIPRSCRSTARVRRHRGRRGSRTRCENKRNERRSENKDHPTGETQVKVLSHTKDVLIVRFEDSHNADLIIIMGSPKVNCYSRPWRHFRQRMTSAVLQYPARR